MPKVIILYEWSDHAVKLGGTSVNILAAWFGDPKDSEGNLDVTLQLQAQLQRDGFVWLNASPFEFTDPAWFRWKRLIVMFSGENEYSTQSTWWTMLSTTSQALAMKVSFNCALFGVVGKSATAAALASVPLSPPVFLLASVALFLNSYNTWARSKGIAEVQIPFHCDESNLRCGDCAICLEPLLWCGDLAVLDCKHCFHSACVRKWVPTFGLLPLWQGIDDCEAYEENQGCPLCRQGIFESVELGTINSLAQERSLNSLILGTSVLCLRSMRAVEIIKSACWLDASASAASSLQLAHSLDAFLG